MRTAASGTQDAFQKIFMGSAKVAQQRGAEGVQRPRGRGRQERPERDRLRLARVHPGLNDASYQGVACNLRNAKSGQYAGSRNFWMVTRGAPTGAVSKFINWIPKNSTAQKIIATEWVPLK